MASIKKKEKIKKIIESQKEQQKKGKITEQIDNAKENSLTDKQKVLKDYDIKAVNLAKGILDTLVKYAGRHSESFKNGLWFTSQQLVTATKLNFEEVSKYLDLLQRYGLVRKEVRGSYELTNKETGKKEMHGGQIKFLLQFTTESRIINIDSNINFYLAFIQEYQNQIVYLTELKKILVPPVVEQEKIAKAIEITEKIAEEIDKIEEPGFKIVE